MHRGLAALARVNQLPPADALPDGAHGRRGGLALCAVREALAHDQLEHPRRWLGIQWLGLSLVMCRASQSRQARPEEAQGASCGPAKGAL
eukprot:scaffold7764_cov45-Phaeocystis_antarctica.AAC.1